jgi:HAMP domain-containing protein
MTTLRTEQNRTEQNRTEQEVRKLKQEVRKSFSALEQPIGTLQIP